MAKDTTSREHQHLSGIWGKTSQVPDEIRTGWGEPSELSVT